MNESPYQSMMENEILFQQQPWLSRVPHYARHAATPIADALTGAGAGLLAGVAAKRPLLGATIGGILGGAHGLVSHNPTPAQSWAFHNPERVHVLKARAAYDAGLGMGMGGEYDYGKTAAMAHLGFVKAALALPAAYGVYRALSPAKPSNAQEDAGKTAALRALGLHTTP